MTPKTALQKQVANLSATLQPITNAQKKWAYNNCVAHIGYRTKKGTITCSDCGNVWSSKSILADSLCGCRCPPLRSGTEDWGYTQTPLQRNGVFQRDNNLQGISSYPSMPSEIYQPKRRADAVLLSRGCATLDFSRRKSNRHSIAPRISILLLRPMDIG